MKNALRLWASGVTVVTSSDGETRAGITVSSFSSVSLEPPLILFCLYHELKVLKQIKANGHFAVSILGEDQAALSAQMAGFAELPEGEDRFYGYDWITAETGSLIFSDALAWFDCKLYALYDGGTHKIVVGEVIAAHDMSNDDSPSPLVYFNRGYRQIVDQSK